MKYFADFSQGKWKEEDFWHAGFCSISHRKPFEQEDDCIKNGYAPCGFKPDLEKMKSGAEEIVGMDRNEYAFTVYVNKQKFKSDIILTSDFAFEEFGAPTFLYGEGVEWDGGICLAKTHIEVTLWEEGINYWHNELENNANKVNLIKHDKFELAGGRHHIKIIFKKTGIEVCLNGRNSSLDYNLYDEGYIGFIGCEGMNRFYNLEIIGT